MYPYITEIYLPCSEPFLKRTERRKKLPNFENAYLARPVHIIPWLRGSLIVSDFGIFFTECEDIILSLDKGINIKNVSNNLNCQAELERLNAYGFIVFDSIKHKHENYITYNHSLERYRKLYSDYKYINFSLVPLVLEIDITSKCNAFCIHCSRNAGINSKDTDQNSVESDITTLSLKHLILEAANMGAFDLQIMGGEPLVHPEILGILQYAKDCGFREPKLSTNGIAVNKSLTNELSKYLNNIQLSLHGSNSDIHDAIIMRNGAFKKAIKALHLLIYSGLNVTVSCTVMQNNRHDLRNLAILAKESGASSVRFIALSNVGRGENLQQLFHYDREVIGKDLMEIYHSLSDDLFQVEIGGFPSPSPINNEATFYGCAAGITHLHVFSNGKINLCGSVSGEIIDDWNNSNNLLCAWHSQYMKRRRRQLVCKCAYRQICSGLCRADIAQ